MSQVIKPLLAVKAELDKIEYPVLCTPKLDGIRCLMVDGVAMSRSMKPIPNQFVQDQLNGLHGFDGELMVKGDYNAVQSGIMKQKGTPDFTFIVFDTFAALGGGGYKSRIEELELIEDLGWFPTKRVKILSPVQVDNEEALLELLDEYLKAGYEGLMARKPDGEYKHGRSTVNEGILLKVKVFHDAEAKVLEVIEGMTNQNELEQDEFGYAKRSSAKANLVPSGTAGSILVEWQGKQFRLGFGLGFTLSKIQDIWDNRKQLVGELATFTYQELSKDGIPRFPKLKGFRNKLDIS